MPGETRSDAADAVRRFNRFYTARIGALGVSHLDTPFSLTEARVLYEVGQRGRATSAELAQALEVDPAQVSRTVARLARARLLARQRAPADARALVLTPTPKGRAAFKRLDDRSRTRSADLLAPLASRARQRLLDAMETIQDVLGDAVSPKTPVVIRTHRPGDFGWIVSRHGEMYAEEYGWDGSFEALVAGIAKEIIDGFDPAASGCWIAERAGERVGAVCLVRHTATVAKLRLFLVNREVRGLGIGTALVNECLRFARRAGYHTVTLWTWSELGAARRVYERAGFVKVHTAPPERAFGKDLVFETWELSLGHPA